MNRSIVLVYRSNVLGVVSFRGQRSKGLHSRRGVAGSGTGDAWRLLLLEPPIQ